MLPEEIAELRRKRYNATIVSWRQIHSDLAVVRIRPDFPRPGHKPGQYSTLGLGYWEPRAPGCQQETIAPGDETKLVRRAYAIGWSRSGAHGELADPERT